MNYIHEMTSDGGKSWRRWHDETTTYTEGDANAIIRKLRESNENLKAFDVDRMPEDKKWDVLDLYNLRIAPAPLTQPSPQQQPIEIKDSSVLATMRRGKK
jgi:hypothetical protein